MGKTKRSPEEPQRSWLSDNSPSKNNCCSRPGLKCATIFFGILATLTLVISLCVIVVSAVTVITTKMFSPEQSGRITALALICVMAVIVFFFSMYALISLCTKKKQPIHVVAIIFIILGVLQLVIVTTALSVSDKTKMILERDVTDSFQKALDRDVSSFKKWTTTQSGLSCCGLNSPDDYINSKMQLYMPPDVPISCCPAYNPDLSPSKQERQRAICKATKSYHKTGCLNLIEEMFDDTSSFQLGVVIGFIILEVLTSAAGFVLVSMRRKLLKAEENNDEQVTKGL